MTDPERLVAQTDDEVLRAVLRAGRAERAPRAAHERTAAAMGLPSTTALGPPVLAPKAAGVLPLARLAKGGALLAVGAGLLFGVQRFAASPPTPAAPAIVAPLSAPVIPPTPLPDTLAPPATPLAAEPASPLPASPLPAEPASPVSPPAADLNAAPSAPATPAPRASARSSLALEVAALDEARALLSSGNASGALARLTRYQQEFPQGMLQQEALLVRIDALIRSGQRPAAAALGEPFLAAHPTSPLARRVRSLLGKEQVGTPE